MKENIKKFFLENGIQPILSIVLIILIIFAIFRFSNKDNNNQNNGEIALFKTTSFESAVNKFLNEDYIVYTRGNLYVKDSSVTPTSEITPTPGILNVSLVKTSYDDNYFLSNKSKILKVDVKSFGTNNSTFFNSKGEIVFIDNIQKQYSIYPLPADNETEVKEFFESAKYLFDNNLFILTAVIRDYQDNKFFPVETSVQNIFSGKWSHPSYTNDEVVNINIQTDPNTGLFTSFSIGNTNPPTLIYFDFIKQDTLEGYDNINSSYTKIPIPREYKTK